MGLIAGRGQSFDSSYKSLVGTDFSKDDVLAVKVGSGDAEG
jgi:hypothetical protein